MKKVIVTLVMVLAATSAFAVVSTNSQGQIIDTYTNFLGDEVSAVIGQVASSDTPTSVPFPGTVVTGAAAPTATPVQVGQVAIDLGDNAYMAVGVTAADWRVVTAQVQADTNDTTTATGYTPVFAGQVLTGSAGTGTNAVWIATGTTSNDWVQVAP